MSADDTIPRLSLATLVDLADTADETDEPEAADDDWIDTRTWGDVWEADAAGSGAGCGGGSV
jgi:hypothetical protein